MASTSLAPPTDPAAATSPRIHTYHCLCAHLLLASTHPLSSLPRRGASSLDKAYILPLPPPPGRAADAEESDGEEDEGPTTANSNSAGNYALLLSAVLDRKPVIVTRDDGFEKRYLQRCGRCRLVVGYQLDKAQFENATTAGNGRRDDVVYLLPGGLLSTEEMVAGKCAGEGIEFGLEG